jgi:dolichol-phosphate mannosyltransferase
MYRGRKIAVVIPAYNVAQYIESVVKGIPEFVDEIIIVNDGSTDQTAAILGGIQDPRVTIESREVNQGLGRAMVAGYSQAVKRAADVVVKMDGDGQMDPQYLPALLDPIIADGYTYTKGNRFLDAEELNHMPKVRLIGNYLLTFLTKLVSGYWNIFDPQNGFVAIDANMLRKLPLEKLARRYFFENDMLVQLNVLRARVKDVPIPAVYGSEHSSMRLTQVLWTFPIYLFHRFWYRIYQKHILREFSPIALFWVFGSLLLSWGVAFGAYHWAKSILSGRVASTGTVMLSVLPLILGFQLALQAILIEIQDSAR